MAKRITITLPDYLMDRVDAFYQEHGHGQKLSDAAKLRFVISFGLAGYVKTDTIQHGGKRPGAGRKAKKT